VKPHPGKYLFNLLEEHSMSVYRLAKITGISRPTLNNIVRERRGITPVTAAKLGEVFFISAEQWLSLQAEHDLSRVYNDMTLSKEIEEAQLKARAFFRE
jgi:addiction module HigA family antidote